MKIKYVLLAVMLMLSIGFGLHDVIELELDPWNVWAYEWNLTGTTIIPVAPNIICNYAGCFDHNIAGERIFYKNNYKFSYDPETDILKMIPCRYFVLAFGWGVLHTENGKPIILERIYECEDKP